jgi:hypothetical protein
MTENLGGGAATIEVRHHMDTVTWRYLGPRPMLHSLKRAFSRDDTQSDKAEAGDGE